MRKTSIVLVLAAVMIFAFAAAAFADHAPNFYINWSGAPANANQAGGPHQAYTQTSQKCAVCHAVHRAPVSGMGWTGDAKDAAFIADQANDPQMLLRSNVANACTYCHIQTSTGGVRLYNGNALNYSGATNPWSAAGFAHNYSCSGCHAVHGAKTFKGAIAPKILRYNINKSGLIDGIQTGGYAANGNANALNADHTYTDGVTGLSTLVAIQDEVWKAGGQPGVTAGSVPMFTGNAIANPIEGTNEVAADEKQSQGSAFCTICHANYSSASELTMNIDGELALFNVLWDWNGPGASFTYKNHPVQPATNNFAAGGSTIGTNQTVAFADATYCRSCHDAGETDSVAGVIENSYPHFTPGYYKFMTSAPNAAGGVLGNEDGYADGVHPATPTALGGVDVPTGSQANKSYEYQDGQCLKCHVNAAGTAGVGLTF